MLQLKIEEKDTSPILTIDTLPILPLWDSLINKKIKFENGTVTILNYYDPKFGPSATFLDLGLSAIRYKINYNGKQKFCRLYGLDYSPRRAIEFIVDKEKNGNRTYSGHFLEDL